MTDPVHINGRAADLTSPTERDAVVRELTAEAVGLSRDQRLAEAERRVRELEREIRQLIATNQEIERANREELKILRRKLLNGENG